jgi:hypothetical protein
MFFVGDVLYSLTVAEIEGEIMCNSISEVDVEVLDSICVTNIIV